MKIHEVEYCNIGTGWKLEKTTFSDLTLLVGISGVGKTQILHAINSLRGIISGHLLDGIAWSVSFTADNQKHYRWEGGFQHIKGLENRIFLERKESEREEQNGTVHIPKILFERLFVEEILLIEKTENQVTFKNEPLPIKFSPYKSVLTVFTEQDEIIPVLQAFKKIYFVSDWIDMFVLSKEMVREVKELHNITTLQNIQEAPIAPRLKLVLAYHHFPEVFRTIQEEFMDIFQQVEEMKYSYDEENGYTLQIREKGTDWIAQAQISSGMLKTLMHIAEMKLMASGSVILIDEFENSLGVNCIDIVAETLMHRERELQYIITSHHPYIINNIPPQYWQIVTRQGGKVSTHQTADLNLNRSKHKAFMQLINLEEYTEGIR